MEINKIKNKIKQMIKDNVNIINIYSMLDRYCNNCIITMREARELKDFADDQYYLDKEEEK